MISLGMKQRQRCERIPPWSANGRSSSIDEPLLWSRLTRSYRSRRFLCFFCPKREKNPKKKESREFSSRHVYKRKESPIILFEFAYLAAHPSAQRPAPSAQKSTAHRNRVTSQRSQPIRDAARSAPPLKVPSTSARTVVYRCQLSTTRHRRWQCDFRKEQTNKTMKYLYIRKNEKK